ncbi:MAG: hypothetical protein N2035_06575 [Chthoniobacterales bacterium]|nr:hypothetical protein [Chthoniobacterales bacterium]
MPALLNHFRGAIRRLSAGVLLLLIGTLTLNNGQVPLGVTISSSRQFWVEDEDREFRGKVATFAETVRIVWTNALDLREEPKTPIRIVFPNDLRGKPREGAAVNCLVNKNKILEVQLHIWERSWVESDKMAEWIFQALAVEYTGRSHPIKEGLRTPLAPLWFVQGLVQMWKMRREEPPLRMLSGLMSGSRPPTASAIIRQRVISGAPGELEIYRLLAYGVWRALEGLPEGKTGLRSLAASLARQDLDVAAVLSAYPSLGGQVERLERQWGLALAKLLQSAKFDRLSISDSLNELKKILNIEIPDRKGQPLRGMEAYAQLARERNGQQRIRILLRDLLSLEMLANPLVQPIVREYRLLAEDLARHSKLRKTKRLQEIALMQAQLTKFGEKIEEELDLWIANMPNPRPSPRKHSLSSPQREMTEPRLDSITRALDAAQERYKR